MLGRLVASTAVALLLIGSPALVMAQATNGQTKAAPMHKAMKKGGKGAMMKGHKMDNVADQLNACQAKAASERQSCMNAVVSQ